MAFDVATLAKLVNISQSAKGGSSSGKLPSGLSDAMNYAQKYSQAKTNAGITPYDSVQQAKDKLAKSIAMINQSDAPGSSKGAAAANAPKPQHDENLLTKALNLLTKPKTAVVAGISHLIDPNRNFLADLRHNVGTADVLAKADWFKNLPTAAKIGVGLAGDIAADPLTYLSGSSIIEQAGGKAGLASEAAAKNAELLNTAKTAQAFGNTAHAAQLTDRAVELGDLGGRLLQKGSGGIGGMSNAELSRFSELLGRSDAAGNSLKGGLYFNVPGTGRIGRTVAGWAGADGLEPIQFGLGRNPLFQKVSSLANEAGNVAKTVGRTKNVGEDTIKLLEDAASKSKWFQGGEGALKRAAINAYSPQQALMYHTVLDTARGSEGAARTLATALNMQLNDQLQLAEKASVDRATLMHALGENEAAVKAVKDASPELYDKVIQFRDNFKDVGKTFADKYLSRRGVDSNLMNNPLVNIREGWQPTAMTQEFQDYARNPSNRLSTSADPINAHAQYVPGNDFMGETIAHPNEDMMRYYYENPNKRIETAGQRAAGVAGIYPGENVKNTIGTITRSEVMADPIGQARIAAGEDWKQVASDLVQQRHGSILSGDNANLNEDMVNAFIDGKLQQVPLSQTDVVHVPANTEGLSAREQVNQIASRVENLGHEIFNNDYGEAMSRYISQYVKAVKQELHFALLSHYGLAELKGIPNSVSAAGAAIDKAWVAATEAAVKAEKAGDRTATYRLIGLQREKQALSQLETAINDSAGAMAAATAGSREARLLEDRLKPLLEQHAKMSQELEQALTNLGDKQAPIDLMRQQIQGERGQGLQSILGHPDVPLEQMTAEQLATHEKSLDLGMENVDKLKPQLQAELDNAQKYEQVAKDLTHTPKDIVQLRSEVKTEAQSVAQQMRGQLDQVGGRLESGWKIPKASRGGEWDWWDGLSRSDQNTLKKFMGGSTETRVAGSFGGMATGRVMDGMPVDVFAEHWRQIANLSPDANIIDVMDNWVQHVLQLNDVEKVANGSAGWTSLVQDWMAPETLGGRRIPAELAFPAEKMNDTAIAEAISKNSAAEFHGGDVPTRPSGDVQAELAQLDQNGNNLVNRYNDVMREHGRREALIASGQSEQVQSALQANIHDPAAVDKITTAATGLADEAPKLPVRPAFEMPTQANLSTLVEDSRKLSSELRQQVLLAQPAAADAAGRVNWAITNLDSIDSHISDAAERVAQLDAEHQQMIAPFVNEAQGKIDQATQNLIDTNRRAHQSLMMVIDGENRALQHLSLKIDDAMFTEWMRTPAFENTMHSVVKDYWSSISRHGQAPDDVADALSMLVKTDPKIANGKIMQYFDKLTRLFKAWSIAQPGFVLRHGYSGMFMNYMNDISPGAYRAFFKAHTAFTAAIKDGLSEADALLKVPSELRDAYDLVHTSGVLNFGTQTESYVGKINEIVNGKSKNVLDRLSDTPYNRAFNRVNSTMGDYSRGAAAMDAAMKTGSMDRIYDIVFKAHFNYEDITNFEKQVMTRISPFYVYFRKAIPAMVEGIFTNPKAFARVAEFQQTIESQSNVEDIVPQWMQDRMNIRLPFNLGGGQTYLMPDLPVRTLSAVTNPYELAGQLNPLIKTPIEMRLNSKIYFGDSSPFQGLVQPPAWLEATHLLAPLSAIGLADRAKDGSYLVNDKALYAVEQMLPFMGRARRLLPTEPRYQDRLPTTIIDFLFGAGLRTNTQSDIRGELTARQKRVDAIASNLQKLGYGGYQTWTKQVATSRKPTSADKRPYLTLIQPKGGLGKDSPYTNVAGKKKSAAQALSDALASGQLQAITAAAAASRKN